MYDNVRCRAGERDLVEILSPEATISPSITSVKLHRRAGQGRTFSDSGISSPVTCIRFLMRARPQWRGDECCPVSPPTQRA